MRILIKDITFSYSGQEQPLFKDLSFSIQGPGFFSLFGFSGCGKSTLARIIAGLLISQKGGVFLPDKAKCLLCYNSERLPGWHSVGAHFEKICPSNKKELLNELIYEFALGNILKKRFFRLSMGQKNRANLIRYLVQEFDVLICDEVLANVDEPSRNHILSVLKDKFQEKTILYISHNVEEVCCYSKKIFILPQKQTIGSSNLKSIEGLDLSSIQKVDKKKLQGLILNVLALASFSNRPSA